MPDRPAAVKTIGIAADPQYRQAVAQEAIEVQLGTLINLFSSIANSLLEIAIVVQSGKVTGIRVEPGPQTIRGGLAELPAAPATTKEEVTRVSPVPTRRKIMAKVTKVKKVHGKAAPLKAAKGFRAVDFQFQDNGDDTCTVYGVDAGGNQIDISSVATLTPAPVSSDTTIITVDAPIGMTFAMHAVGKLSVAGTPVQITATATWNDGSVGPFTFSLPCDVVSGGPVGILIVPGTPTVH